MENFKIESRYLKLRNELSAIRSMKTDFYRPQSFTKYLRLTLDFMGNSTLREKFNFYFSIFFC